MLYLKPWGGDLVNCNTGLGIPIIDTSSTQTLDYNTSLRLIKFMFNYHKVWFFVRRNKDIFDLILNLAKLSSWQNFENNV